MLEFYYEEVLKINTSRSFTSYFPNDRYAVLDIETTGLSPDNSKVILIGLVICQPVPTDSKRLVNIKPHLMKEDNAEDLIPSSIVPSDVAPDEKLHKVYLLFNENDSLQEERDVLLKAISLLKDIPYMVTFNGASFDIPFLQKRMDNHGIDYKIGNQYNLDIFKLLKSFSTIKEAIGSLSQKNVEKFMGIDTRNDTISGGESIKLYKDFVENKTVNNLKQVLLHNYEDILQLQRLMEITQYMDLHHAMFKTGFPLKYFTVEGCKISRGNLIVTGTQNHRPIDYIDMLGWNAGYSINLDSSSGKFTLSIPLENKEGDYFFYLGKLISDPKRLSYLPAYESEYLILNQGELFHHWDINMTIKTFLEEELQSKVCAK